MLFLDLLDQPKLFYSHSSLPHLQPTFHQNYLHHFHQFHWLKKCSNPSLDLSRGAVYFCFGVCSQKLHAMWLNASEKVSISFGQSKPALASHSNKKEENQPYTFIHFKTHAIFINMRQLKIRRRTRNSWSWWLQQFVWKQQKSVFSTSVGIKCDYAMKWNVIL